MTKDMTYGNPGKILFYFAIPMVLGNILQQFYTIVDSIIVGNFVGAKALAAVGASYPIIFLFITIANGAGIGVGVVVSQFFGAKEIKKVKSTIFTSLIFITIFSVILTIAAIIASKSMLNFMNTPSDIFVDANDYLIIYFMSIVFLFVYNIMTSIFNALGNSKLPLMFLIISTVINIVLDLLFVTKFNMGVKGVAYSTLIAQVIVAILCFIFLYKEVKNMKTEGKLQFINFNILKLILSIGIPSIVQQSIVSVGNLLVQALVNRYGYNFIAGFTSANKIDSIIILPMANMSNAVSTFTAQNIGANKSERVKEGWKAAIKMIAVFCLFTAIFVFFFGKNLISMFVDSSTNVEVINIGYSYLKVVSIFYFFMGLMVITNGILRGAGDMKVFLLSTTINLSTRVIFAYTLANIIGKDIIWWAIPLGWIFASTISIIRYRSGRWNKKVIVET